LGVDSIAKVALELEKQVAEDEWFTSRKLYPNVDYWTALLFHCLGFPTDMFPVWMYIPRVAGYLAHLVESLDDPEYKIFRPRQVILLDVGISWGRSQIVY
jgi:citrate synthase